MADIDLSDRPDRFARWNTRWVRVVGALAVVLAAAVVVPTLTSEPNRDETAIRTSDEDDAGAVDLDDDAVDAGLEIPADGTVAPSIDEDDDEGTTTSTTASVRSTTSTAVPGGPASTTSTTPATSPTTAPVTTAAPPATCGGGGSAELSCRFDNYRRTEGLPAMSRTGSMNQKAQAWAEKMAADGAMSHSDLSLIFSACGGCTEVKENVGFQSNGSAAAAWQAWLNSSTHLGNIRTAKGGVYGMGAATTPSGAVYVVQMFGFS